MSVLTGKCYVCGKKLDRNELGFSRITHERCQPGTAKWVAWYRTLPRSKQTEAGRLLYKWAIRKKEKENKRERSRKGTTSDSE